MRKLFIALTAFAAASPAIAQGRHEPLPSPREIDRVGAAVGNVAESVLDVDVGPVVESIDRARGYGYGRRGPQTLGDLAGRRDPYARERVRDTIGATTAGIGAAVEQMTILTPILERALADATFRIEDAMRRRGYDSRYAPRRDERYDRDYDRRDERRYDRGDDDRYEDEDGPR